MVLEFYCLFFSEHLGVLASEIQEFLTIFTIGLSLARFWKAFGISGGDWTPPNSLLGTPLLEMWCNTRLGVLCFCIHWYQYGSWAHSLTGNMSNVTVCVMCFNTISWSIDSRYSSQIAGSDSDDVFCRSWIFVVLASKLSWTTWHIPRPCKQNMFLLLLLSSSSSSSSSYICHAVRPLVDPFRSHVSRSLFKVYRDSFCQLDSSVSLPWVICYYYYYYYYYYYFSKEHAIY